MILDSIENLARYAALNPLFPAAAEFLAALDLAKLTSGRIEIDGERLHATAMVDRELKLPEDAPLEAHDRYVDIQLVVRGEETFGWADRATCSRPRGEMDATKDILFFDDRPANHVTLSAGQLVVFFPWDAHAPLIGKGTATKVIVKILN